MLLGPKRLPLVPISSYATCFLGGTKSLLHYVPLSGCLIHLLMGLYTFAMKGFSGGP